nr:PREDICTED: actin cytoskeleton-regulatory complex protein PAN1-like [Bemisia tabaci]
MDSGIILKIGFFIAFFLEPFAISGAAVASHKDTSEEGHAQKVAQQGAPNLDPGSSQFPNEHGESAPRAARRSIESPEPGLTDIWEKLENSLTRESPETVSEPAADVTHFWEELTQTLARIAQDDTDAISKASVWQGIEDSLTRVSRQVDPPHDATHWDSFVQSVSRVALEDPQPNDVVEFWNELLRMTRHSAPQQASGLQPSSESQDATRAARHADENSAPGTSKLREEFKESISRVARGVGQTNSTGLYEGMEKDASRVSRQANQHHKERISKLSNEVEDSVLGEVRERGLPTSSSSARVRRQAGQHSASDPTSGLSFSHLWQELEESVLRVAREVGLDNSTSLWENLGKAVSRVSRQTDRQYEELWNEFENFVSKATREASSPNVAPNPRVRRQTDHRSVPEAITEPSLSQIWEEIRESTSRIAREVGLSNETSFLEDLGKAAPRVTRHADHQYGESLSKLWNEIEDSISKAAQKIELSNASVNSRMRRQAEQHSASDTTAELSLSDLLKELGEAASRVTRQIDHEYADSLSKLWNELKNSVSREISEADSSNASPRTRVRRQADKNSVHATSTESSSSQVREDFEESISRVAREDGSSNSTTAREDPEGGSSRVNRHTENQREDDVSQLWKQFEESVSRMVREVGLFDTTNISENLEKYAPRVAREVVDHLSGSSLPELWREFGESVSQVAGEIGLRNVRDDMGKDTARVTRKADPNLSSIAEEWEKFFDHSKEISQEGTPIASDSVREGSRITRDTAFRKKKRRESQEEAGGISQEDMPIASESERKSSRVTRDTAFRKKKRRDSQGEEEQTSGEGTPISSDPEQMSSRAARDTAFRKKKRRESQEEESVSRFARAINGTETDGSGPKKSRITRQTPEGQPHRPSGARCIPCLFDCLLNPGNPSSTPRPTAPVSNPILGLFVQQAPSRPPPPPPPGGGNSGGGLLMLKCFTNCVIWDCLASGVE